MLTKEALMTRLKNACQEVIAAEAELTEIDSHFGDADHGVTMTKIANAIIEGVEEAEGGMQAVLDEAATNVMMINGGSAVPLWNTWLDALQENAAEGEEMDDAAVKEMFQNAYEELASLSKAKVGDKTMMDSLIPATEALGACDGDIDAMFNAAAGTTTFTQLGIPQLVVFSIPYIITLIVLLFSGRKSLAPAHSGIPFEKGMR